MHIPLPKANGMAQQIDEDTLVVVHPLEKN